VRHHPSSLASGASPREHDGSNGKTNKPWRSVHIEIDRNGTLKKNGRSTERTNLGEEVTSMILSLID